MVWSWPTGVLAEKPTAHRSVAEAAETALSQPAAVPTASHRVTDTHATAPRLSGYFML